MTFAQGHALLIGVNQYQHAPRLNVPMTATDVLALADTLRDPQVCGYPMTQVTVLTDAAATHTGITTALTDLAQRTTADDTVLVCYSGHGHYDIEKTYGLMTHETQLRANALVPGTALSQHDLLALVRAIPARRVLLVFNACHAGALSPTLTAEEPFPGTVVPDTTRAALLATGEGRIIITACRANQYAFIGTGPQTIFMQAFIAGLQGTGPASPPQAVTVFDLYTHLYHAVDAAVQQLPAWVHDRYGMRQEPELTILKGVGPFVVALPHGTHPPTPTAMTMDLPRAATVRAIDQATSQQHFDQINRRMNMRSRTTYHGDYVEGNIYKRTINTGGGDYAEGNITKHQSTVHTVTVPPHMPVSDRLAQARTQLEEAIQQAEHQGHTELVEDLRMAALHLKHAHSAQQQGRTQRQQAKTQFIHQILQLWLPRHPQLQIIIDLLNYEQGLVKNISGT